MVCATDPYRTIVFQLLPALVYPCPVECIHVFRRSALVPFALVHTDHLTALHTYTSIAKEVRRVGKYHVELETELLQQFDAIAVEEGEGVVGRFEIREYFIMRNTRILLMHFPS